MVTNYFQTNKTTALQLYNLKSKYEYISCSLKHGILTWIQKVKPSEISREYTITLKYDGSIPKIYLYNQGIMMKKDEYIPHCYKRFFKNVDDEYVQICLYYPKYKEWKKEMFLSETIIPWAIDWLKYYELWRITGKWFGGGIDHEK